MKIKHSELILGILLGGIIFSSVSICADDLFNISPNPFKITVNGIEKPIEGYNINGSSYFKLRDIGKQVGFDVGFEEETILINTNEKQQTQRNKWANSETYFDENGSKFLLWNKYNDILKNTFLYIVDSNDDNYKVELRKNDNSIVMENVEFEFILSKVMISEQYFNEIILPLDTE